MIHHDNLGNVVFNVEQIASGVSSVADQLNNTFNEAVVITVVPGGILFTADLVRKLTFPIKMDYISCPHTPGDSNNTSDIVYHNNVNIDGQDVIVIDDAIESGGTMKRLVEYLSTAFSPKSLSIATLFAKPGRVMIENSQFFAYELENDDLLVGYGLPWEDKQRNIPYISTLVK